MRIAHCIHVSPCHFGAKSFAGSKETSFVVAAAYRRGEEAAWPFGGGGCEGREEEEEWVKVHGRLRKGLVGKHTG